MKRWDQCVYDIIHSYNTQLTRRPTLSSDAFQRREAAAESKYIHEKELERCALFLPVYAGHHSMLMVDATG